MKSADPPTDIAALKGFGPKSVAALRDAGIHSTAQLRACDAYALYARLKAANAGTSLNFLYAILGAQEDVHWQEIKRARRTEILFRLDEMGLAPR